MGPITRPAPPRPANQASRAKSCPPGSGIGGGGWTRALTRIRAPCPNPSGASLAGSDTRRVIGFEFVIIMYAGVVLGGMGSMLGAFWGGFTMGLVQQLSTYFLPFQLQNATIFLLFLAVVLLRPQGLFGKSVERT